MASLEAVVHSDGSRPVLFVEDDFFDIMAPAAANWVASLSRIQAELRNVCQAVGRVNDPGALRGYQGTAWAIDDGVVVTNYHILEAISTNPSRTDGEFAGALKPVWRSTSVWRSAVGRRTTRSRSAVCWGDRAGAPEYDHPTIAGIEAFPSSV
jgi:hypothetical protein